jgi:hypothetical protein
MNKVDRRDFLKLAGLGGVVFASGLGFSALAESGGRGGADDFYFIQLSDTHWGLTARRSTPTRKGR